MSWWVAWSYKATAVSCPVHDCLICIQLVGLPHEPTRSGWLAMWEELVVKAWQVATFYLPLSSLYWVNRVLCVCVLGCCHGTKNSWFARGMQAHLNPAIKLHCLTEYSTPNPIAASIARTYTLDVDFVSICENISSIDKRKSSYKQQAAPLWSTFVNRIALYTLTHATTAW